MWDKGQDDSWASLRKVLCWANGFYATDDKEHFFLLLFFSLQILTLILGRFKKKNPSPELWTLKM